MIYNRRKFVKLTGGLTGGLVLSNLSALAAYADVALDNYKPLKNFGIQLYSLRDVMPNDPKGVLKQVSSYGFKQIESYEGAQGMFWGMKNTEFKKYLADLDMCIVSAHCDIEKDFERKAAEAAAIGMKYLICPYKGPQKSLDDFKKFAEQFNQKGEVCRKNGIRFAYHNHDYSFKTMEGKLPQDVMMEGTGANLVDYEMDIYWVVTADHDPEAWLKKYKNRFRLCHIKDRSKTPGSDNGKNSVDLGTGSIDFPRILKTARKNGMDYFIYEQEAYPGGSSLEAARDGAAYLQAIKI